MKGLEKLTSVRLAEVLSHRGLVPTDAITDALFAQDQFGEPFIDVLVSSDHITEWDLAKVVVEHFQLPFVLAGNYDITPEPMKRLPEELLFQNLIVPLDRFGEILIVSMPIMTPYETLKSIREEHECVLFPYVGLISENRRILRESFENFEKWETAAEQKRQKKREEKSQNAAGGWMDIFDSADAAVRDSLDP